MVSITKTYVERPEAAGVGFVADSAMASESDDHLQGDSAEEVQVRTNLNNFSNLSNLSKRPWAKSTYQPEGHDHPEDAEAKQWQDQSTLDFLDSKSFQFLPSTHPEHWEAADISIYLQRRGLPAQLCSVIEDSGNNSLVNGLLCRSLEDEDLESLGVDNAFHRRRLLREFAHLFDNWPSSCEGWTESSKSQSRPGSAYGRTGSWNQRKRVPWPPPPVRVRPSSAPSKGSPSNFAVWLSREQDQKKEVEQTLLEQHRATQAKAKMMEDNNELVALRAMFNQNTRSSASGPRGSTLLRRFSLLETPGGISHEGAQSMVTDTADVKQQLLQVRQRAKDDLGLSSDHDDRPRRFSGSSPERQVTETAHNKKGESAKMKRLNKQLSRSRNEKIQPHQKKRESKADCLRRMSVKILAAESPEDEAEMKIAFERYAHEGLISRKDLWQTLADMGLSAKTRAGKVLVNQCFEELWATFHEGDTNAISPQDTMLTFDFAVVHVKDVRRALNDQLRKDMWDHFQKADEDRSGKLDLDEVLTALATFDLCPRDEAELNDLLLAINEIDRDGDGIDFEEFVELASHVRGHLNQERRQQQHAIAKEARMDRRMFTALRHDIIDLFRGFMRYDADKSGYLQGNEITLLLLDTGLAPQNSVQRVAFQHRILNYVDHNGYIHLPQYFMLCYDQRMIFEKEWRERTHALFHMCDRDNSGSLESSEVGHVLVRLGLQPRNKAEQKEIGDIVEEADLDGSGSIDLDEFEIIVQRVDTKLRAMQRDRDAEFAHALGFSKARFQELLELYEETEDLYQTAGADGFDITGLRHIVNKLRKPLTSNALRSLFRQLDEDRLGALDIFQHLQFMWIIENDAFEWNTGKIVKDLPAKPTRQDKHFKSTVRKTLKKQTTMASMTLGSARADKMTGHGAALMGNMQLGATLS